MHCSAVLGVSGAAPTAACSKGDQLTNTCPSAANGNCKKFQCARGMRWLCLEY